VTARTGPARAGARPASDRGPAVRRGSDRGSAAVEFLGFLPILLLVALAGVQLGLLAYVGTQAGGAARTAARTDDSGAGQASMSGWLRGGATVSVSEGGDSVTATVTIKVPSVLPGISIVDPVVRRATMPRGLIDR
jgi:TadE-like protein